MVMIMTVIRLLGRLFAAVAIAAALLFLGFLSLSGPYAEPQETAPEPPPPPPPLSELLPGGIREDSEMTLSLLNGDEIEEISMEYYLIGVVAAEMPAGFPLESLKAQAIAARTMVMYNIIVEPKSRHPGINICSDYSCCMAYRGDDELREAWAGDYVDSIVRIIDAVVDTDGVYMLYRGEPILAVFHSSSAGKTESSANVWVTGLPYLVSVNTPESSASVPDFITVVPVLYSAYADTITGAYPDAVFNDDGSAPITEITRNVSGRILEIQTGGVTIRGTELRSMFGLRSTAINIEFRDGDVVFTVSGYGHGVGMSQYGAADMARDGIGHRDILRAYYRGVVFSDTPRS